MIRLGDLRDYWKAISDWVTGDDINSKPKVEVDNLPAIQEVENPSEITKLNEILQKLSDIETRLDDSFNIDINKNNMRFYGNSSDTKPVHEHVEKGSTFYEIDTGKVYIYDGSDWSDM